MNKFTLWHNWLNINKWKPNQYLFDLVFSRNAKKAHTDQSVLQTFLLCVKRSVSLTFRSNSCKKVFLKCVYHLYNLLRRMFFILCDNWKTLFFYTNSSLLRGLVQLPCCCVLWTSVLKDVPILYPLTAQ